MIVDRELTVHARNLLRQAKQKAERDKETPPTWQLLCNVFYDAKFAQEEQTGTLMPFNKMLARTEQDWGILIPFAILVYNWHGLVLHYGVESYHANGYTDGLNTGNHAEKPVHDLLIAWFEELGMDKIVRHGRKVLQLLSVLTIEPGEKSCFVPDADQITKDYQKIALEFKASMEQRLTVMVDRLLDIELE